MRMSYTRHQTGEEQTLEQQQVGRFPNVLAQDGDQEHLVQDGKQMLEEQGEGRFPSALSQDGDQEHATQGGGTCLPANIVSDSAGTSGWGSNAYDSRWKPPGTPSGPSPQLPEQTRGTVTTTVTDRVPNPA